MNMSRRGLTWFGCLLIAAGLCGCFESSVPLSPPGKVHRDGALVGSWRCGSNDAKSDDAAILQVFPFDDAQYYAEWTEIEETTRYRAYGSRAGDVILLNIQGLTAGSSAGTWLFLRYRLDPPGTLKIALVSNESLKGLDESAALKAIRRRAADDTLYESWTTCSRQET